MLMLALVPFALGFAALLNPPTTHAGAWLSGSLLITYAGFSAASIAYQSWGAAIGDETMLRTRLTAAREGFGLLGVLMAAALPGVIALDMNTGVARLAWVLPALLLPAAALAVSCLPAERPVAVATRPLWQGLRRVCHDPAFRRLLIVFMASGIAAAVPATLFLFFVADVLRLESAASALLGLYFLAGAVSLPGWVRIATRWGRVRAWLAAMALAVVAFAGAGALGAGDLGLFALVCLASGLALGADLALPAAIAADLGERRAQSGAVFGVWNLVGKLNLALAAGGALPLLAWLGYAPASGNGLPALQTAYALAPLLFKVLAAALLWRWRHDLEIRT
jgi:GPH family glycoside/pentoside/hexuronide:cation symporter